MVSCLAKIESELGYMLEARNHLKWKNDENKGAGNRPEINIGKFEQRV
jgi:hypothetical protein